MKKIAIISISVFALLLIMGCSNQDDTSSQISISSSTAVFDEAEIKTPESYVTGLPDRDLYVDTQSILESYYDAQNHAAFKMFQKNIFENLADDWTAEITNLENVKWNYETFAQYHILDSELNSISESDELYYCTFTADNNRFGYIVMSYDGSSLRKLSVAETEYRYDLQTVLEELVDLISFTGVGVSTVVASRTALLDHERNKTDEVIRLTDTFGNELMYYFTGSSLKNYTDIVLPSEF